MTPELFSTIYKKNIQMIIINIVMQMDIQDI